MRETRLPGSEGGAMQSNALSLPLSKCEIFTDQDVFSDMHVLGNSPFPRAPQDFGLTRMRVRAERSAQRHLTKEGICQ